MLDMDLQNIKNVHPSLTETILLKKYIAELIYNTV